MLGKSPGLTFVGGFGMAVGVFVDAFIMGAALAGALAGEGGRGAAGACHSGAVVDCALGVACECSVLDDGRVTDPGAQAADRVDVGLAEAVRRAVVIVVAMVAAVAFEGAAKRQGGHQDQQGNGGFDSLPRYLLRSAIGICSMLSGFWAIGHLPLSQAISLSYSTPLFVTILAVFWLGEHVRKRRWAAVIVGFIGVLVIVRPGTADFTHGSLIAVLAAARSSPSRSSSSRASIRPIRSFSTPTFSGCPYRWSQPCSCGSGRTEWNGAGCC